MKHSITTFILPAVLAFAATSALAQDATTTDSFTIAGSSELVSNMVPALIQAYSSAMNAQAVFNNSDGDWIIQISDGDITTEVTLLADGPSGSAVEIAGMENAVVVTSRVVQKSGIIQSVLAADGLVPIINSTNALQSISMDSLRGVLRGDITNWSLLGGPDAEITVYFSDADRDLVHNMEQSKLALTDLEIAEAATFTDTSKDASDLVSQDPYGLGLVTFSSIRNSKPMGLLGACGLSVNPTAFNLVSGDYPLGFLHFAIEPEIMSASLGMDFLEYLQTDQARQVISNAGYADLGLLKQDVDNQGRRITHAITTAKSAVALEKVQQFAQMASGAERLSSTFRTYGPGKGFDLMSALNVAELATGLALGDFGDKTLVFAGFANKGAEQLAQSVRDQVLDAAGDPDGFGMDIQVVGYKNTAPVVCGKGGKNDRVEVWIKDADPEKSF